MWRCLKMEETFINLISNVGFPIVVSIALFQQINKTSEMYLNVIRDFRTVLDNNTKSLNELARAIDRMDNGGEK